MKRGNLLWTGSRMMLSEHRQLLNERFKKEQQDGQSTRKEFDFQQLEEWQYIFKEAVSNQLKVIIKLINKEKVSGYIVKYSTEEHAIYLKINNERIKKINIHQVLELQLNR